ncbi:TsaB protein, required for threonylcarbamoyladenosine (t(6)A) formation in tRNA [Rhodopirellula islandica]|uniref:TsaB protein, required for threonylcarbamoyladenosine (T(6)A) formation in tRNA n=1 Tax=Rhodopirellula islandica TaxID=595434 RepID=A0A0J1BLE6_RHOIS|nr:tRNA (adenosine(37)-N6)-threonylcarbamoyltransferase complex dimerization subunit type 1 TsaB [Rhodopirellula islandica]KLU07337.1 TsaB protein, required for threonylcarbamoyladenosine (t(6)A) formation in tRNA [Rhodopirellula islandica]
MDPQTEFGSPRPVIGLALEVIGREGSVAVIEGGKVVQTLELPSDVRATASLTPALQTLLQAIHPGEKRPEAVSTGSGFRAPATRPDYIAVADGPGSFTGLRIAAATAKTLAYAWGIPVVTLDSLSVLAAAVLPANSSEKDSTPAEWPAPGQRLLVGLDAYRGQTFVGWFREQDSGWVSEGPVELLDRAHWLETVESAAPGIWATGDAMKNGLPADHLKPVVQQQTLASAVARLANQKYLAGQTTDPMDVLPKYFRPSAAEEKAAANQSGSAK